MRSPLPDRRRTPGSLLYWWESRRLFYNAVVGTTGVFSSLVILLFSALPPFDGMAPPPILPLALAYGLAANLCYSMGWGIEMLARLVWGRQAPDLGPILFRQGLIFSVGLTLLPIGIATFSWLMRIVFFLV